MKIRTARIRLLSGPNCRPDWNVDRTGQRNSVIGKWIFKGQCHLYHVLHGHGQQCCHDKAWFDFGLLNRFDGSLCLPLLRHFFSSTKLTSFDLKRLFQCFFASRPRSKVVLDLRTFSIRFISSSSKKFDQKQFHKIFDILKFLPLIWSMYFPRQARIYHNSIASAGIDPRSSVTIWSQSQYRGSHCDRHRLILPSPHYN